MCHDDRLPRHWPALLAVASGSLIVAIVSAYFAGQRADVSKRQLALVVCKIGMVTDPAQND